MGYCRGRINPWRISGPTNIGSATCEVLSNLIISGDPETFRETKANDDVVDMLKKFWEVEEVGRKIENHPSTEIHEERISFNGRFYETGLPWKENSVPSSSNYRMCETRLQSLHRKLKNEPVLLHEYDKIIQEELQANIIEQVPESHCSTDDNQESVHFSPHHAVI